MVTGRDNLDLINQHLYQTQGQQEESSRRLEDLHRQLDAIRLEMSNGYRELARLRLDDLQAGQVIAHLNETDQALFMLVQNLKRTRLNLKEQIEASRTRQQQLEAHRKELEKQRDEAGEARQRQLEQTHKRLSATDAYRQQQERAQQAGAIAGQADDKATRTEQDRQAKSKPYEADHLFMYLWNRRFLTPDYRGGWFTRQLDNWVAKIIDFQRNRANYYLLLELPRRLRDHATKVKQTAQLEAQALQTMERQAAEADGFPALQARVQEAERQLQKLDADIEAEETQHQKLLAEEAQFNSGTDPLSKQIIDLQAAALTKEPLPSLSQKARGTPRPEDDVIVAKIDQLHQRQEQLAQEIQSLNTIVQQQQRNMGELAEVRRRYRQRGYDGYDSRFPGDFALAVLLGRMLDGLANPDTVWGEIDRQHHSSGPADGWGGLGGDFGGSGDVSGGFGGGGGGDFYTDNSF